MTRLAVGTPNPPAFYTSETSRYGAFMGGCFDPSLAVSRITHYPFPMITKAQLESMFANIAEKTDWDLTGQMLWGYFFKSPTEAPLAPVAETLEEQGYTLVGIREDEGQWWLHVEQVEPHAIETLLARNTEFYALAKTHDVEYDGMDVGPAVPQE